VLVFRDILGGDEVRGGKPTSDFQPFFSIPSTFGVR
jgi:hypothetical protein